MELGVADVLTAVAATVIPQHPLALGLIPNHRGLVGGVVIPGVAGGLNQGVQRGAFPAGDAVIAAGNTDARGVDILIADVEHEIAHILGVDHLATADAILLKPIVGLMGKHGIQLMLVPMETVLGLGVGVDVGLIGFARRIPHAVLAVLIHHAGIHDRLQLPGVFGHQNGVFLHPMEGEAVLGLGVANEAAGVALGRAGVPHLVDAVHLEDTVAVEVLLPIGVGVMGKGDDGLIPMDSVIAEGDSAGQAGTPGEIHTVAAVVHPDVGVECGAGALVTEYGRGVFVEGSHGVYFLS